MGGLLAAVLALAVPAKAVESTRVDLPPPLPEAIASPAQLPPAQSRASLSLSPLASLDAAPQKPAVAVPAATAESPSAQAKAAASPKAQPAAAFDGARLPPGWAQGSFESAVSAVPVAYKTRPGGPGSARVFAGGLALNESFETVFASQEKPAGSQTFVWTRAHPPTPWAPTRSPLEADARDLARAVVLAGRASPTGKVELVLHSFGTVVFQRLVQLRGEPEIDEALSRLAGSRVVFVNGTTHFSGSEARGGAQMESMGQATKLFVDWLDAMDATAETWKAAAALNPFLAPQISLLLETWNAQRRQALALASREAAAMMRKDLEAPWRPAFEPIRKAFLAALQRDSEEPGWQEALLRRTNDVFRLDFTKEDARHVRKLGVRLTLVHAAGDQLLDWNATRAMLERLGIPAPANAPAPGALLKDKAGLFEARVVDSDHYLPLKKPELILEVLDK